MNQEELELHETIEGFIDDPLGFVEFVFPWGKGELSSSDGPDVWQAEILSLIGDKCLTAQEAVQIAVRSGKGIGKTALISWIILWFISTRPNPQIIVTANTQSQLDTATWRELAVWHNLSIHKHWFTWTATKFIYKECPETWYAAAIPWSIKKAQAFAGKHAQYTLMIFDEASEVDDKIWEKGDGAMTTSNSMFIAFGNPTMNTGRFSECFGKFRHRWITREIDSRTARLTNKVQIQNWIDDYGEDSDYVRVNVKGQEPRCGTTTLISSELIQVAMNRKIHISQYMHAPVIIGVDVARFGKDKTSMYVRQGLATLYRKSYREIDTMTCASIVAELIKTYEADATFVDVIGIGAGVVDRLKQLGYSVIEVNSGKNALEKEKYFNLRAEMWLKTKYWLESGGCLPNDNELRDDLGMVTYGFDGGNRYQITKKEDLPWSPDDAEALIHTFAYPVNERRKKDSGGSQEAHHEFDPFSYI
jgi:Ni2+-binding GTPase involved in maturation of urease and hydrogenase